VIVKRIYENTIDNARKKIYNYKKHIKKEP